MKKSILILAIMFFAGGLFSQTESPYTFETVKDNSCTDVKNQCRTGTCWSYSTISFFESELIRLGKGEHDLSEMFNVRMTYPKKVEYYIRFQGKTQFSAGSLSHDVMNVVKEHGLVPNVAYTGLDDGETIHNHGELDIVIESVVKGMTEKNKGRMSEKGYDAVDAMLDVYLGEVPEEFLYEGKTYTPESFRDEMGIVADDYVSLSSFTHHDFWDEFVLEVPDNFAHESVYNLPLENLVEVAKDAINNGYTFAWDADVSEAGFSFGDGMAIVPKEKMKRAEIFVDVIEEMDVNQENRQDAFDNFETTDDHLMHITGIAKDQNGKEYFIMKNSWGDGNTFGGKQYVSMEYFKLKTISIMVHGDVLSKDLKKKLDL